MDGDFELNKPGWYETDFVVETGFDPDQYGNEWYSVKFKGMAEEALWLAKDKPEDNKKYWGHFEMTKSGKKMRFKRDKEPEDEPHTSSSKPSGAYKDNSKNITLGLVWKTIAGIRGLPENDEEFAKFYEIVDAHYSELIQMQDKISEN